MSKTLEQLKLDNRFASLGEAYFSRLPPSPFPDLELASYSPAAAALLDLGETELRRPEFTRRMTGLDAWPGSEPLAQLYAGHQFGVWVPQLGDGRAILLGEVLNEAGEHWDIQLKGAGPTPYSRMGDGRAVLRSTIREYLCSEAMHGLGIPTTRALALFTSQAPVYREEVETAAMLIRMAQSHIRFGSFEVFYHRGQQEEVKRLADFVIQHYFPECLDGDEPYVDFLRRVVKDTAELIAQWQGVGFCHGVMNTDNMSILGLTLDYGPYGFMEAWNAAHVCNHSDVNGRYAFNQQPQVGQWNLVALVSCFLPLIGEDKARAVIETYASEFDRAYSGILRQKLGLLTRDDSDDELIGGLFSLLQENHPDYTLFFRRLCDFSTEEGADHSAIEDLCINREAVRAWLEQYRQRLLAEGSDDALRSEQMKRMNPKYVLRNYMAEVAIRKARDEGDFSEVDQLLSLLSQPYDEQPEREHYADLPPDWASGIEVSCSS